MGSGTNTIAGSRLLQQTQGKVIPSICVAYADNMLNVDRPLHSVTETLDRQHPKRVNYIYI